jgi:hypothetical protein
MEKILLIIAFVVGNALDSYTTWLGLFKLPPELRGSEMNPLFGDITRRWKKSVITKAIATVMIAGAMWFLIDMFYIIWLNIVLGLVVLNNAFIYLTRRITKRKVWSLGKVFTIACDKAHLPKAFAYIGSMVVLGGVAFGIMMVIK